MKTLLGEPRSGVARSRKLPKRLQCSGLFFLATYGHAAEIVGPTGYGSASDLGSVGEGPFSTDFRFFFCGPYR